MRGKRGMRGVVREAEGKKPGEGFVLRVARERRDLF